MRHTKGNKELYDKRKETIERLFGTAKEHHGFRYTQQKGKARMAMKVGLTFACLNLKKLAFLLDFRDMASLTLCSFSLFSRSSLLTSNFLTSFTQKGALLPNKTPFVFSLIADKVFKPYLLFLRLNRTLRRA